MTVSKWNTREARRASARKYANPQFTCENCGTEVPWRARAEYVSSKEYFPPLSHDHCPSCGWSKHVAYADDRHPPCGAMMKPFFKDDGTRVVHRCVGCGFIMDVPAYGTAEADSDDPEIIMGVNGDGYPVSDVDGGYLATGSDAEVTGAIFRKRQGRGSRSHPPRIKPIDHPRGAA